MVREKWWRRRESNPRPKKLLTESFHAFSVFIFVSWRVLRTDKDVRATSLIDLTLGVQTELLGPAYSATIGIRP